MNSKIHDWVKQCSLKVRVGHGDEYVEQFNYEKFAQLVAKDCVELVRNQYVGGHVVGNEYRNRGLEAAEFVICLEYDIEKQNQPIENL